METLFTTERISGTSGGVEPRTAISAAALKPTELPRLLEQQKRYKLVCMVIICMYGNHIVSLIFKDTLVFSGHSLQQVLRESIQSYSGPHRPHLSTSSQTLDIMSQHTLL